ncbi:MAG: hypothetical protein HQL68_08590 [Magnetococcales bacterium]|nr:hypothetical protein [Magnetococcales bacterium]
MKFFQFIFFAILIFFSFAKTSYAVCIYGDCKSGYGESVSKTGIHYRGEFEKGIRLGNGTLTWPDGSNYEGFFKDDKFNGLGKFVWNDGTKYIGYWKNGLQHGEGEKTFPSGSSIYGKFKYGKLQKVVFIMEPGAKEEFLDIDSEIEQKIVVKEVEQKHLPKNSEKADVNKELQMLVEKLADDPKLKQITNPLLPNIGKKTVADLNLKTTADAPTQNSVPLITEDPIDLEEKKPVADTSNDDDDNINTMSIVDKAAKKLADELDDEPLVAKWEQTPAVIKAADVPVTQETYESPAVEITEEPISQQMLPSSILVISQLPKSVDEVKDFINHNQKKVFIFLALFLTLVLILFLVKVLSNRKKDRQAIDALLNTEKDSKNSNLDENPFAEN